MILAWGAKVEPEFAEGVVEISARLRCDPSHLMACMAFETGGRFSPSVRNADSGATGLLQFMPSTAVGMGTTTEALSQLTRVEQLAWVERYLQPYAGRIGTLSDLYMAILWPRAVGQPDDHVLFAKGGTAYEWNKGLDLDGDGRITKAEASTPVAKRLADGLRADNAMEFPEVEAAPIEERGVPARPEDVERINEQETEQPMAPLLIGLAGTIFQAFIPSLQALITNKLGKATGDQAAAGQTSAALTQQLSTMLMDAAKKATGETSELQAAAKVEADAKAQQAGVPNAGALATAVAEDVAGRLDAIAPFVEKLEKMEADAFAAEEDSRDRAAARAARIVEEGGYDLRPILARFGISSLSITAVLVASLVVVSNYFDWNYTGELMTLFVGLVSFFMAKVGTLFDNAFGSSRGSAAKDVIISELASGRGTGSNGHPPIAIHTMPRGASKVTTTTTK